MEIAKTKKWLLITLLLLSGVGVIASIVGGETTLFKGALISTPTFEISIPAGYASGQEILAGKTGISYFKFKNVSSVTARLIKIDFHKKNSSNTLEDAHFEEFKLLIDNVQKGATETAINNGIIDFSPDITVNPNTEIIVGLQSKIDNNAVIGKTFDFTLMSDEDINDGGIEVKGLPKTAGTFTVASAPDETSNLYASENMALVDGQISSGEEKTVASFNIKNNSASNANINGITIQKSSKNPASELAASKFEYVKMYQENTQLGTTKTAVTETMVWNSGSDLASPFAINPGQTSKISFKTKLKNITAADIGKKFSFDLKAVSTINNLPVEGGLTIIGQIYTVIAAPAPPPPPPTADTVPPVVSISSPAAGTYSGTITVNATATDATSGIKKVIFKYDGTIYGTAFGEDNFLPYSANLDTTTLSDGIHNLRAFAEDNAGNKTISAVVTITVNNAPLTEPADITPPTVSITSPASGATVSGAITMTATATDTGGIAGVQFKVDNVNINGQDTSAPYETNLNPITLQNGAHTITAVATDTAALSTTSSVVTINVQNPIIQGSDLIPPLVSITSPADNQRVSGTIEIKANASDNTGVVSGIQFKLNDVNIGAEDTTFPYLMALDTNQYKNLKHSLTAVARDQAGNTAISNTVKVTFLNARATDGAETPPADTNNMRGSPDNLAGSSAGATLSGSTRLRSAPDRSETGPGMIAYLGIYAAINGALYIRKKIKKG